MVTREGFLGWLNNSLDAICVLTFTDPADRLCMLDVTIKDVALHLTGVYAPNGSGEQHVNG